VRRSNTVQHQLEVDLRLIPSRPRFGRNLSLVAASESSLTNGRASESAFHVRRIRRSRSRRPALQLLRLLKLDLGLVHPVHLLVNAPTMATTSSKRQRDRRCRCPLLSNAKHRRAAGHAAERHDELLPLRWSRSVSSLSSSAGAIADTYTYDSFGKLTASTGSLTNSLRYTTRESDTETGLFTIAVLRQNSAQP